MRYLAIDYGRARVGIAISDPMGLFSRPLTTLSMNGMESLVEAILEIVEREQVEQLLVGIPERRDGSPGTLMPEIETLIQLLRDRNQIVHTISESFSSVRARELLRQNRKNPRKDKGLVDGYAAALFLQEYLDGRS